MVDSRRCRVTAEQVDSLRKDIALRCSPALAGIACFVVAARVTAPPQPMFVALVVEGIALLGLAAFLVWRYLKTPATPQ